MLYLLIKICGDYWVCFCAAVENVPDPTTAFLLCIVHALETPKQYGGERDLEEPKPLGSISPQVKKKQFKLTLSKHLEDVR